MISLAFTQYGYTGYWMMPKGKFIIPIEKSKNYEYIGHFVWLKDIYYPKGDNME